MNELVGKVAVVVGASRGLGRGITEAFLSAGAHVVALARDVSPLADLSKANTQMDLVAADGADAAVAGPGLGGRPPRTPAPGPPPPPPLPPPSGPHRGPLSPHLA